MKNIVVVGGTKRIGKNIVDLLLVNSDLFIIARTKNDLADTANAHFIGADVTQPTIDLAMVPEVIDGLYIAPEA